MILSLAASVGLAQVADCRPASLPPAERSVLLVTGMGFPDPLAIRFVTDRALGEWSISGGVHQHVELDAIPLGRVPGRSLEGVLVYAGATRQRDGSLRLRGGEPRIYVDGIKLRSDLE